MFNYYLRLALLSIKRNPILSSLMMLAIAVGIGAFMTMLTVHHIMSGNPVWYKNDKLYAVQIDAWNPESPRDEARPDEAPDQLTFTDAMALHQSEIPTYKTAMFKIGNIIQPENEEIAPFILPGRMNYNDFFEMFDVPFIYGGPWDDAADRNGEFVTVLSKMMNDKVFGGENSVGKTIRMDNWDYTVVGVIDTWDPRPKYYDVTNGPFNGGEGFYIPFQLLHTMEPAQWGNTNCWKAEKVETYEDFLASECIWIQYWVQLDTAQQIQDYRDFVAGYSQELAEIGRSARPENSDIKNVEEWLEFNQVVQDDNRVLVGLSFLFLLVCLLNTVGLLLAKFLGRAGEISVRRALGASKMAIFRQQLTECGFIGLLGGLLGLGVASLGLMAVKKMYDYPGPVGMDLEMISAAFVVAVLASMAAGLWPSWQICRVPPAGYLKTQ